jgi:hypothetical protein
MTVGPLKGLDWGEVPQKCAHTPDDQTQGRPLLRVGLNLYFAQLDFAVI